MTAARRGRPRALRDVDDTRMTLVEHLVELRERLVKALLGLGLGTVVAFALFPRVLDVVKQPYCSLPARLRPAIESGCTLYVFGVVDAFAIRLQVSLVVGALLASPVWVYQVAAFVTPGLYRRERRVLVPFVAASVLLFALGAFFAYLTMDKGLAFLLAAGGDEVQSLTGVKQYLSFFALMLLAFGLSFEFPLLLVFLELLGVVDERRLRGMRRPMYFGLAVFTAVVTPSQDPVTFLVMLGPLAVSYELVVLWARVHARARRRRAAARERWDDDEASPVEQPAPIDPAEPIDR